MERKRGITAALVSAASFGVLAVLTALAYRHEAEPLQLLVWRFFIAALLLGVWTAIRRPAALKVPRGDLARFALLSVTGYGAASLCFAFALQHIEASLVAVLLYTYPAIVALAERVIYGTRLTPARLTAVAFTFAGCVLIAEPFGSVGSVNLIGIALGLGAGAGYAAFSVMSHRWLPGRSRSVMMSYLFVMTGSLALVAALATDSRIMPVGWDLTTWSLLAVIVLLPTFVAIVLYWRALRSLGASQAALISTFEPLFTIGFAALLLGESLSPLQWAGAALVLSGVLVSELRSRSVEEIPAV